VPARGGTGGAGDGLLGATLVQAALGHLQTPTPVVRAGELRLHLIAAPVAEPLVFLGVDGVGLLEDLPGDPL
jgi:hypothetical protein